MSHHGGFTKLKVPDLDKLAPSELTVDKMFPQITVRPYLLKQAINAQYGVESEKRVKGENMKINIITDNGKVYTSTQTGFKNIGDLIDVIIQTNNRGNSIAIKCDNNTHVFSNHIVSITELKDINLG